MEDALMTRLAAPAFPAHKGGGRASSLYSAAGVADSSGQAELATAYITQLKEEAAEILGSVVAASLVPIQYNGDFNWSWTDGTGAVNQPSYNYISGAVTPSSQTETYQVGAGGSFANIYQQLINGIQWQFSAADNAALQAAMTNSQTQATSVVSAYKAPYGIPTPTQIAAAQAINPMIQTALDYILLYEAGYLWAGIPKGGQPLALQDMQNSPNLRQLLKYAPPSAQPTVQAISAYLNALGPTVRLMDMQSTGGYTLQQIKNNLTPSSTNGGVLQLNPPSGTTYYLGYSSNMTPSQILQGIQNTGQKVTLNFSANASAQSSYNISFSGGAGLSWGGELLGISAGTSFQGDVAAQQGSGSTMNISMVYPGVTIIPLFPTSWQQTSSGSTGWWYETIIHQAWQNLQAGSQAASGFSFGTAVPGGITLGENGVGYLSAIVVSAPPTVTIEFTEGNFEEFSSWLSTHTTVSVSLFGFIPLGSSTVDTYTASASQSQSGSGFSLTLTPPAPGSAGQTIPLMDQTVPVLAGQVGWAGQAPS